MYVLIIVFNFIEVFNFVLYVVIRKKNNSEFSKDKKNGKK